MNILFYEEKPEQDKIKKLEALEKEMIKISVEELKEKYPGIIENSILLSEGQDSGKDKISRIERINKILNSQKENLDYRYDVKAYKEYLKEWLKHKDEKEYLNGGVLSFAEFWEHDIDYEFEDYKKILKLIDEYNKKNELVTNGGVGSGNFNPGQGRGVGKPSGAYSKNNILNKLKNKISFSPEAFEYIEKNASDEFIKTLDKVSEEVKNEGIDISNITILYDKNLLKKKILAKAGIKSDGTKRLTLSSGLIKEKNQDFLGSKTYHTDTTIEGVLRHEFGHIKIYQLVDKLKWATKDRKYSASEIEYAIAMKSSKIENILDFPKISNKDMSEYGITSAAEFCAESFSNKEYSQMTKDAYKIMTNPDKVAEVLKEFSSTAQKEGVKIINSKNNYKDICVGYFVSKKDYDNYMKSRIERLNFLQKTFNGVNKGNPYHDEKGRFTSKNGKSLTGSSSFVAGDKEIDEYCDDIVELSKCLIRNKVKGSKTKVLGKNLEGRRVDILNSDHVLKSFEDGHEDDKRVEEIKQQIENKKKAGAVVVVIRKTKDGRNVGEIVDGNHTFSAFRKLKNEGKYYYVPVVLTTPKLVDKWEKSFKSIDDMLNHEKTLLPVREFSREKTER